MTQAKIEPGETDLSLAGKPEVRAGERGKDARDKDLLPELGLKSPAKEKKPDPPAKSVNHPGAEQHGNNPQRDDMPREQQKSHGVQQNRGKKDGHATQLGSGQDQQSSRAAGRDPTHKKR